MKEIKIIDTTLRDGHQSLWATRMTTDMMLPVLDKINNTGYQAVELMAMVHFDAGVRYLREDPWERIRIVNKKLTNVPTIGWIRSKNLIGFDVAPDDIVDLMVEKMIENGLGKISAYDGLLDNDNIVDTLIQTKKLGAQATAAFVYCESPIHTDELYAKKITELLKRTSVDSIMIKDAGGVLTPERAKTLVPAVKKVIGDIPLEIHCHSTTGLAPLVYLGAAKGGADVLHTGVAPLANGWAQPSVQQVVRNLRNLDFKVNVNDHLIQEVSDHFYNVAELESFPLGVQMEYDSFHYKHQIPGGMLSNLHYQLEQAGISNKYHEVLEEISIIREELAWPIMVTPFSQLVATQAVLNVMHGERYKFVPDEVKKYVLGHYGNLLAPVDPNILDKIIENGSKSISIEKKAVENMLPQLRKQYPNVSSEELLLRFMIKGNHVDEMNKMRSSNTGYNLTKDPLMKILKTLTDSKELKYIQVKQGSLQLRLGAGK